MTREIDPILIEHWNAFLDKELDETTAAKVEAAIASSPENAAFIEGQRAFNDAISESLVEERRAMLSPAIRGKFASFLEEESEDKQAMANQVELSLLEEVPSNVIPMSIGRIAAAAVVIIAISVFGTLVATGAMTPKEDSTPLVAEVEDLDLVLTSSMQMFDTIDYSDEKEIAAAFVEAGAEKLKDMKASSYGCDLSPVSVTTRKLKDGSNYTQLCFCTCGRKATYGPNKGKPIKNRFILNIVKGNILPKDCELDAKGCWSQHLTGYHSFSKYDAKADKTYIVIIPRSIDDDEAEKMAEPFLV